MAGLFDFIFGKDTETPFTPPPPVFEPPPVMPTPNDDIVKRAKKKSIAAQVARRGRASTILTQNEDAIGTASADHLGV